MAGFGPAGRPNIGAETSQRAPRSDAVRWHLIWDRSPKPGTDRPPAVMPRTGCWVDPVTMHRSRVESSVCQSAGRTEYRTPPSPGYCTDCYRTDVARRRGSPTEVAGHSHRIAFSTMPGQGESVQPSDQQQWAKVLLRALFLLTAVDRRTPLFAGAYCTVRAHAGID
jgi:hypothetical protein